MGNIKEDNYAKSLSYHAWRKLRRNKLAIFGMAILGCALLIAILGANIRPDQTDDAAYQIPEIQDMSPGSNVLIVKKRKNQEHEEVGFFGKLFFGYEQNAYKEHAIMENFRFEGNEFVFEVYRDDSLMKVKEKSWNIADMVYALEEEQQVHPDENGNLVFITIDDGRIVQPIDEIKTMILNENVLLRRYWLGTDANGRDYLSRIMGGVIISLSVGFIAVLIALLIGIVLGALAGYFRGWVDDVIMWLINVIWSIPTILMVISVTLALGKGYWQVFVAVGLTMWVEVARIVRGQVMSVREKEFVEAGRALGFRNGRIIFRHVLPNVTGPVIVISAANFASAILIEAGLSFLGVGTQPPTPSWGTLIQDHFNYLTNSEGTFLAIIPGVCIIIMVLALMLIGNALRDALDSKSVTDISG